MCDLFGAYLRTITSNKKNIGFSFWTYKTGSGNRRVQQWDYSWLVSQGIIRSAVEPPTKQQCSSQFL
jgi:hypothetical protein